MQNFNIFKRLSLILAIISFACVLNTGNLSAQIINNVQIVPAEPLEDESFQVIYDATFFSGDCPQVDLELAISGNELQIFAVHQVGLLAIICEVTDTVKIVNGLHAGEYELVFQLQDASTGNIVTSTLNFTVSAATGIGDHSPVDAIQLYPNPFHESVSLLLPDVSIPIDYEVYVTDVVGRVVLPTLSIAPDQKEWILDTRTLDSGMYFVNVMVDGQLSRVEKVIRF